MDFWLFSDTRLYKVFEEGRKLHPQSPELEFWELYIKAIHLGEDMPSLEKVLELTQQPNSTIVPYFWLYGHTENPVYLTQMRALVQIAQSQPTCKNRYILSIAERYVRT